MTLKRQHVIFSVLILALLAVNVVVTHDYFTAPYPGHNDFMSRWEGARSYLQEGLNPYGEEASLNIQMQIYGRPIIEGEDAGLFAYPFYTVFVVAPFVPFEYAWASALMMVLLEALFIITLLLILDFFGWKPRPLAMTSLVIWTLLFYFSARNLILGQLAVLVYFGYIYVLWALPRNRDLSAGVLLAITTIKPQMGYILVPFLLLWALKQRRLAFIGSFSVTFGLMMVASFLLMPTWLTDWLNQVFLYPTYTELGAVNWIIMDLYLGLGTVGEWALNLPMYAAILWMWFTVLVQNKQDRLVWVVLMTLVLTNFVVPRTAVTHYVTFLIPMIVFYSREIWQKPRRAWLGYGVLLLTFLLPWVHFLVTVEGEREHPTQLIVAPIVALVVLVWTRRLWWEKAPNLARERHAAPNRDHVSEGDDLESAPA